MLFQNLISHLTTVSFNEAASNEVAFKLSLMFNTVLSFVFTFVGSNTIKLVNSLSKYLITFLQKNNETSSISVETDSLTPISVVKSIKEYELQEVNVPTFTDELNELALAKMEVEELMNTISILKNVQSISEVNKEKLDLAQEDANSITNEISKVSQGRTKSINKVKSAKGFAKVSGV